ncbi:MAG: hypothetical protein GX488_07690 [Clostridiales bacterium]|nr:hypothetical protein [Clostridiales bacterium]
MEVLEVLTAFLLSLCFITLLWTLKGLLLRPVKAGKSPSMTVIIAAGKDSRNLEREVRGLRWLREDGRLYADILIVDTGMDSETARIAESLSKSTPWVTICRPDEIENIIIRSGGYG